MSKEALKKTLGIVSKVITVLITSVAVLMMVFTLISTLTFDRNDRNLFGIRFYVVLTDSMSLSENNKNDKVHFDAGDLVLIKGVKNKSALKEGDIIAFVSQNSDTRGKTITHKIRKVYIEDERVVGYITYGTNTGTDDDTIVEPDFVIGKYAGKLPSVGKFFTFLKTTTGYIVCILVPFLLLILWQGINTIRLFKQYRREEVAVLEAERQEIAKEREMSAKMMAELMALREQLTKQAGESSAPQNTVLEESKNESSPTDNENL